MSPHLSDSEIDRQPNVGFRILRFSPVSNCEFQSVSTLIISSPHLITAMTKDSALYKWTSTGVGVIQSGFALLWNHLITTLLSCWHWTRTLASNCRQNYPSITALENYTHKTWESICSAMTVEVISVPRPVGHSDSSLLQSSSTSLPVLRLNSVAMDEYLTESARDSPVDQTAEFISSSNYNSQSDDGDSGLVFTDADENELSSDDAASTDVLSSNNRRELPQEPYNNRRDSDSSGISSDGQEINEKEAKEATEKLIRQVESMFSDEHLGKDGFLLKHVRRRSDGFVSLKLVAGLRKVKQISRDFPTVLSSLRKSSKLEVNEEGTKIRRIEPLTPYLKSLPTGGNKEKENKTTNCNGASSDSAQDGNLFYHSAKEFKWTRRSSFLETLEQPRMIQKRNSMFLSPTTKPTHDDTNFQVRPKSNSYCEGIGNRDANTVGGTSVWLQRRMESSRAASEGSIVVSGVVRQPRGPDGTRGFARGYRQLISAM